MEWTPTSPSWSGSGRAMPPRSSRSWSATRPGSTGSPTYREDGHREGDQTWLLADWSDTPEQELLSRETRALVHRAIDGLPEHYRAVLVLRDIEGLSSEETAAVVGESVASVKSRLHRARMALRERLTRHFGPRHGGESR